MSIWTLVGRSERRETSGEGCSRGMNFVQLPKTDQSRTEACMHTRQHSRSLCPPADGNLCLACTSMNMQH